MKIVSQIKWKRKRYDVRTKVKIWGVHDQCWMMGDIPDIIQIREVV